jgi:hypothetical protein
MAQDPQSKKMLIQLLEGNDPSAEVDRSAIGRWHEYLDSYVLRQPTEWLPEHRDEGRSAIFLRRRVFLFNRDGYSLIGRTKIGPCQATTRSWDAAT